MLLHRKQQLNPLHHTAHPFSFRFSMNFLKYPHRSFDLAVSPPSRAVEAEAAWLCALPRSHSPEVSYCPAGFQSPSSPSEHVPRPLLRSPEMRLAGVRSSRGLKVSIPWLRVQSTVSPRLLFTTASPCCAHCPSSLEAFTVAPVSSSGP